MKKIKPKYDYSLLKEDYPDRVPKTDDHIRVICSIHGEFRITYRRHKSGFGCRFCKVNYWTKDKCINEAKKYKTKSEWSINSSSSYDAARRNSWLDDCCKHMNIIKQPNGYWNLENCIIEAKKYKSRIDWKKNSRGSYNATHKNGWMNDCSEHMVSKIKL